MLTEDERIRMEFEAAKSDAIKKLCLEAHKDAAAGDNDGPFMPLRTLGYKASKALCEKVWELAYLAGDRNRAKRERVDD